MSHLNTVRFPEDLAVGMVYGPEFVTEVVVTVARKEKRNQVSTRSLCVGDFSSAHRFASDFVEYLKFFRAVRGRLHTFRLKDPTDYACALAEGVVAEIDSTHFQLQKKYETGGLEELRDIQQPIALSIVLENSGAALAVGVDYTLDDATGIITTAAPHVAANLTWSGEFDNAVRFDTDKMAPTIDAFEVFSWSGIPVREVVL